MKEKDSTSTRGIVHAEAGRDKFSLSRFEPNLALQPFVEHYWIIRYNLPAGIIHTQTVLSYPNVNLAFEQDDEGRRGLLYGVPSRPFIRKLYGSGLVIGVKFRAGGFHPFWQRDISLLTGTTVPVTDIFGQGAAAWTDPVLDADVEVKMAEMAEAYLLELLPKQDPQAQLAARIVQEIMDNRSLVKVEQLSIQFQLSLRQLQRLFRKYVGVSPKWVIKRFRLQEAAERLERDEQIAWADIAAQLGYFDQAHLIKDFQSVLGQSPGSYRRQASIGDS